MNSIIPVMILKKTGYDFLNNKYIIFSLIFTWCFFQQLSQFWYDESTISILSNIATELVQAGGKIALVSCPSLYKKIKETCKPATEGFMT